MAAGIVLLMLILNVNDVKAVSCVWLLYSVSGFFVLDKFRTSLSTEIRKRQRGGINADEKY